MEEYESDDDYETYLTDLLHKDYIKYIKTFIMYYNEVYIVSGKKKYINVFFNQLNELTEQELNEISKNMIRDIENTKIILYTFLT